MDLEGIVAKHNPSPYTVFFSFQKLQRVEGIAMVQGYAFEELHHNERLACILGDFVDGANVGMVQSGRPLASQCPLRDRVGLPGCGGDVPGVADGIRP